MSAHRGILKEASKCVKDLQEQYGLEAVPDNVQATLQSILLNDNPTGQADAAVRKMEMACLAAWARGEVSGPDTPEALERRAKQAENLAAMFTKKGDAQGAKKQVRRAEQLRKQAQDIGAQQRRSKENSHGDDVA